MKSIPSGERFGNISMRTGDAPRHTETEHERCAYYTSGEHALNPMCPHGELATGGFYSEDLIRELRETFQYLDGLGAFDYDRAGGHGFPENEAIHARLDSDNVGRANMMLNTLRELLK